MFTRISDRYQNCTAVVIGAGGIGGAIIRQLAGSRARIVVGDRDPALLGAASKTSESTELHTHQIDVRDPASVGEFFAFVMETIGAPQFLFYTAGILNLEPLAETTPALWDRAVDINLNGA